MSVFDLPTFEVDDLADLDHEHDDDCRACAREGCGELNCNHEDGEGASLVPGSTCPWWLAIGDCPECNGKGEISLEHELPNGAVREYDVTCRGCGGRGVAS